MMMRNAKPILAVKGCYVAMSLLFGLVGLALIQAPRLLLTAIGILSGIMLVAFGVIKLTGYLSKDLYRLAFQFDLAFGVLLIALGTAVLCHPQLPVVYLLMGVAVLADGLCKLQSALDARRFGLRQWGVLLGLAIGAAMVGAALILWPQDSGPAWMPLLGVGMLMEGILNLCTGLFAVKVVKNQLPETDSAKRQAL